MNPSPSLESFPRKVAIIGASGFVGTRLVEKFVLGKQAEVVPIARTFSSLALLARFELPWNVCDVLDVDRLAEALTGCDAVVHAALGDPTQIVKMAGTIYAAAEKARVKRLVVLSSAAVHGLNPAIGSNEGTAISDRQSSDYNNAKVRAEQVLSKARQKGSVELVQLRPSIIYGPRCRMLARVTEQLMSGTAFLIGNGDGICNAIYVDNLIEAIRCALTRPKADGQVFLVGDNETVTWREIYARLAAALEVSMDSVSRVTAPVFRKSFKERVDGFVAKPFAQALLPAFPGQAKRLTKVLLGALKPPPQGNAWTLPPGPSPYVDEEMATLQQCAWKFPTQKAAEILGFKPGITFADGMNRTVSWLKFAGYPVSGVSIERTTLSAAESAAAETQPVSL
jgi:nucleoside-diphosphate-sugar epimerase